MTNTDQGNLGKVRAILELHKLGYVVSTPLVENIKYDLVIEKNGILNTVQVKTTRYSKRGIYKVGIATTGGNRKINTIRKREYGDYDYLFVVTEENDCYFIPSSAFKVQYELALGVKYQEYKLG